MMQRLYFHILFFLNSSMDYPNPNYPNVINNYATIKQRYR